MQNEEGDNSLPFSRTPVNRREQTGTLSRRGGRLYQRQPSLSSQIWTPPSLSFSSQSSLEHDPDLSISAQEQRRPQLAISLPLPTSQPAPPSATTSAFFPSSLPAAVETVTSENRPVHSSPIPYPTTSFPRVMQEDESQGPPLPYPYPSAATRRGTTRHRETRGPAQNAPHPQHTPQPSRHVSRSRRSPPRTDPYSTRRPVSLDVRSQEQSQPPAHRQTHRASHSRHASQPISSHQPQYDSSRDSSQAAPPPPPPPLSQPQTLSGSAEIRAPYDQGRMQSFTRLQPPFQPIPYAPPEPQPAFPSGMSTTFAVSHPQLTTPSALTYTRGATPFVPQQMQTSRVYPTRGAQPLPEVGQLTTIPSSYSLELGPRYPPPSQVLPAHQPQPHLPHQPHTSPLRRHRRTYAELARASTPPPPPPAPQPESPMTPVRHPRSGRRPSQSGGTPSSPQKRRRPPEPYSSYAIMLADIILQHPRHKMTLQEIYILLKERYGEHFQDETPEDGGSNSGWRNTVRHALSVNKWFKKQYRTDADARLDEIDPDHVDPPPLDHDIDNEGRRVTVAPPTRRVQQPGGIRPLKGGYWFIREKYRHEVVSAIAKDKGREEQPRREQEEEEWGEMMAHQHQMGHMQMRYPVQAAQPQMQLLEYPQQHQQAYQQREVQPQRSHQAEYEHLQQRQHQYRHPHPQQQQQQQQEQLAHDQVLQQHPPVYFPQPPHPSPPSPPPLQEPRQYNSQYIGQPQQHTGSFRRDTGSGHYMRYPPSR